MRILKTSSLVVVFLLSTIGIMRADSVTSDQFQADSQIVQTNLNQFHSSPLILLAVVDFDLGNFAGQQAEAALSHGNLLLAQLDFQTAINDFNQALNLLGQKSLPAPSTAMPDAGSLALLGCSGIALFGALKKKYSN
jgi:hypothetical protein